jgi:hypothetical protein
MQKYDWSYEMDYMPFYCFQQVSQICNIWTECSTGLNGFLPVWNLNEGWGARWQQGDQGQGTENCHCACIVELFEKLIAKLDVAEVGAFHLAGYAISGRAHVVLGQFLI